MRLKTRLNRRIKINKSKDEKVPIAWEQGKEISKLGYRECKVIQDTDLDRKLKTVIHYKISEQQDDFWWSEEVIDEIVFEHATIHNVEFEWGTFGRAYRSKPDVRKCQKQRVSELHCLNEAEENEIIFETVQDIESGEDVEKCKASIKKITGSNSTNSDIDESVLYFSLSYNQMVFDYYPKNPLKLQQVNFRSVENDEEYWGLEAPIPEVVYEHALLQNVEFEWGTWGRGVRFKADVRGKDVKLGKVHKAEVGVLYDISEETQPLTVWNNCHLCQASVILSDRHIVSKETRQVKECPQEKEFPPETQIIMKDDISNIIYKNTKYFCKKCDIYICNACFSNDCMNHDVQWIGNATFACESIYHKFNVTK